MEVSGNASSTCRWSKLEGKAHDLHLCSREFLVLCCVESSLIHLLLETRYLGGIYLKRVVLHANIWFLTMRINGVLLSGFSALPIFCRIKIRLLLAYSLDLTMVICIFLFLASLLFAR
jgi:hypothetical protein